MTLALPVGALMASDGNIKETDLLPVGALMDSLGKMKEIAPLPIVFLRL
jgi:hypothetical protein